MLVVEDDPDLIILDVRLPDGSRFDFCKQMRSLKLKQPILMLTVRGDEMDKVLGLEMGADDYLTKLFRMRKLVSHIHALFRRAYGNWLSWIKTLCTLKTCQLIGSRDMSIEGTNRFPSHQPSSVY